MAFFRVDCTCGVDIQSYVAGVLCRMGYLHRYLVYVVLITVSFITAGCAKKDKPENEIAIDEQSTLFAKGVPIKCANECLAWSLTVARSHLGLDPDQADATCYRGDYQNLLAGLNKEASAAGGSLEVVPIAKYLRCPETWSRNCSHILINKSGHLYVSLGIIKWDGKFYYQVLHGDAGPSVVSQQQMEQAGFVEAWLVESKRNAGACLSVGKKGIVRVDKIYHNFGEVQPFVNSHVDFTIENIGDTAINLKKPQTSCGCAVADIEGDTMLLPGRLSTLHVAVQTQKSLGMRHTVLLQFSEQGTKASRPFPLYLFGNWRQSMEVVPETLDFGKIDADTIAKRSIRLHEVETDRFTLKSVNTGKLPLHYSVESDHENDGFATYRLNLSLDSSNLRSGEHCGNIVLVTDSAVRPEVTIPVMFCVKPHIQAVPSRISFGRVVAGETVECKLQLVSKQEVPGAVTVLTIPKECSASILSNKLPLEVVVTAIFNKPGIWRGLLRFQVGSVETIDVECSAMVRHKSE